jgi:hypothetical protein
MKSAHAPVAVRLLLLSVGLGVVLGVMPMYDYLQP